MGIGEIVNNLVSAVRPQPATPDDDPFIEGPRPGFEIVRRLPSPSAEVWRSIIENARTVLGFAADNPEIVQEAVSHASGAFAAFEEMNDPFSEMNLRITAATERWGTELEELGLTRFPVHFESDAEIAELIDNRHNLAPDGRPLAVVVYPREDHNGAFYDTPASELISRGYRVVFYEANSEDDLYNAIRQTGQLQRIDLLIIGGHGVQERTAFGAADPARGKSGPDAASLDILDEMEMLALRPYLADGSVIALSSCSTGQDGLMGNSVSNMLARVFPQSTVYAPAAPAPGPRLVFDENNRVIDAQYQCLTDIGTYETCTYQVPAYSSPPLPIQPS